MSNKEGYVLQINIQTYPNRTYNTIQYNTIQYNTIQYNTIQYNTIQYKQRLLTGRVAVDNPICLESCNLFQTAGTWPIFVLQIYNRDISLRFHSNQPYIRYTGTTITRRINMYGSRMFDIGIRYQSTYSHIQRFESID